MPIAAPETLAPVPPRFDDLIFGGVVGSFIGFLSGFNLYATFPENAPERLSGAGYWLYRLAGVEISKFIWLAASLVVIGVAAMGARGKDLAGLLLFSLVAGLFFLPSHNNYYIPLTAAAAWALRDPFGRDKWITAGMLLLTQSLTLGNLLSAANRASLFENVALLDSLAITIIFVAMAKRHMHCSASPNKEDGSTSQIIPEKISAP
ncbi:MAG: hypothetical protein AAGD92_11885 [Pseudomonadota bacterium]